MSDTVDIGYNKAAVAASGLSEQEFTHLARFIIAATLYRDGKVTSGEAALLCEMEKVDFLSELPQHGFPVINLGPEEFDDEMELARMVAPRVK